MALKFDVKLFMKSWFYSQHHIHFNGCNIMTRTGK